MKLRAAFALVIALLYGALGGPAPLSGTLATPDGGGREASSPTDPTTDPQPTSQPASAPTGWSDNQQLVNVASAHVEAPITCTGDGTSGNRVQAVYVRPSDRPDRFLSSLSTIARGAGDVEGIVNGSAAVTGGVRHVRWVTDDSCRLKVLNITMTPDEVATWSDFKAAMADRGYTQHNRKYMAWVDGTGVNSRGETISGIAKVYDDDRASSANRNDGNSPGQLARIDVGSWLNRGIAAHEFGHILGAVQRSAPNGDTNQHHCYDEADLMCYDDDEDGPVQMKRTCAASRELFFDCNNDDYFHTNPPSGSYLATHWNTANSSFLEATPSRPANDHFGDAIDLLSSTAPVASSNRGAGREPNEAPIASNAAGHTVWFRWTAPSTNTFVFDTNGSRFDTVLAVYAGSSVHDLTLVGVNDNVANSYATHSRLAVPVTAGTTYMIAVDGAAGWFDEGAVVVAVGLPPSYDNHWTPYALSSGAPYVHNNFASRSAGEPVHAGHQGGASLWFSWTAPSNSMATFRTTDPDTQIDTVLAVYTTSLSPVASNDDAASGVVASKVSFTPVAGQKYLIAVDGKHREAGRIVLSWSQVRQPIRF